MGPKQEAFFLFFPFFWQQLLTKVAEAQLVVLTEVTGGSLVAEAVSPSDPCLQGGWVRVPDFECFKGWKVAQRRGGVGRDGGGGGRGRR